MRLFLLLFLSLLLAGCPAQTYQTRPEPVPQLEVRGTASIRVKPDQVEMALEAVTAARSADEALAANSAAIDSLRQLLQEVGLEERDYRTGQFSIQPQWSRPPRPAPANWEPAIDGYRVSNSLQIETSRVDLAGHLLALAQQAGVNKAGNLRFSLADPEGASRAAIAAATSNARERAAVLARAAGVRLGALLEARVEESAAGPQPMLMMAEAAPTRGAAPVPISAGDVEVRATVVLRYALSE